MATWGPTPDDLRKLYEAIGEFINPQTRSKPKLTTAEANHIASDICGASVDIFSYVGSSDRGGEGEKAWLALAGTSPALPPVPAITLALANNYWLEEQQ